MKQVTPTTIPTCRSLPFRQAQGPEPVEGLAGHSEWLRLPAAGLRTEAGATAEADGTSALPGHRPQAGSYNPDRSSSPARRWRRHA